ncbi:MAG: polysaccharide lyase [Granulosicoccus sp.]|nr:polysaccharide lyase [Granulosicoccus sp.]
MLLNITSVAEFIGFIVRGLLLTACLILSTVSMAQPDVATPAANSTLSGTSQTFVWTAEDVTVERWWLYIGTAPGSSDIVNSGDLGTSTRYQAIGMPVDGSDLYARLWYYSSSQWRFVDSKYIAANLDDVQLPAMVAPLQSTLMGGSAEFEWRDNNTAVNYWWLYAGTRQGASDIYNSGPSLSNRNSVTLDQLPVDGSTLHVRLWFRTRADGWQFVDSAYTTSDAEPQPDCVTNGGRAGDTGLKTWCWQDLPVASGHRGVDTEFSERQLSIEAECNLYQITNQGDRLGFKLDLHQPAQSWCNNDYNLRAEVSTRPWPIGHAPGTEEWFGWNYTFGENYVPHRANPWLLFQVHEGTRGRSPQISIWAVNEGGPGSGVAGELHIVNATGSGSTYNATGIVPVAGQSVDIVIHVIWGDENTGLLEAWMNGEKVYSEQKRTIYSFNPVGGNAKFGMYKWAWRNQTGVQSSLEQGIDSLESSIGALRILTRAPDDPDYQKDSYDDVAPR